MKDIIQGISDLAICGNCHEAWGSPIEAINCNCGPKAQPAERPPVKRMVPGSSPGRICSSCYDLAEAEAQRQLSIAVVGEMGDMD